MNGTYHYKLVIIGDGHIGKTTMLSKFIQKGVGNGDFVQHTMKRDCDELKLQIHDTMGQERFRSLTRSYYRGARGCLVCFNTSNKQSFQSLRTWLRDLNEQLEKDIPKLLVGIDFGKIRSEKNHRESIHTRDQTVPESNIKALANEENLLYVHVDISHTAAIENVFNTIVDLMEENRRRHQELPSGGTDIVNIMGPESKRDENTNSCCK